MLPSPAPPLPLPPPLPSPPTAVRQLLCAGGCERQPHSLDWAWTAEEEAAAEGEASTSPSGLVAYACDASVLLHSPSLHRVICCLTGHTAAVRCVRVLRDVDEEDGSDSAGPLHPSLLRLLSGGADCTVRCWTIDRSLHSVIDVRTLRGHGAAVNAVDGCWVEQRSGGSRTAVVVSASQDHSLRVWTTTFPSSPPFAADWQCVQVIPHPASSLLLSVALTAAQQSEEGATLVLAAGGVDCSTRIHLARVDFTSTSSSSFPSASSPSALPSALPPASLPAPRAVHFHHAVALSGHTDWVRCLSFTRAAAVRALKEVDEEDHTALSTEDLLLATASQDHTIRLWRLQWTRKKSSSAGGESDGRALDPATATPPPSTSSLGSRGCVVQFASSSCSIRLDSLIEGHEDWVMNVAFQPQSSASTSSHTPPLLSCGADGAAIIWSAPQDEARGGVWRLQSRLGQMSVGGINGLFGVKWGPAGRAVMAYGYTGSLHLWTSAPSTSCAEPSTPLRPAVFASVATASGHSLAVTDLSWEPRGRYLVSVSDDQTTRLFAPVPLLATPPPSSSFASPSPPWLELARPQVHGYDLRSVCVIPGPVSHLLASGADEKVIRIFLATQTFVEHLARLSPPSPSSASRSPRFPHSSPSSNPSTDSSAVVRAIRAHLPELGLSNRGLQKGDEVQRLRGLAPSHAATGEDEGATRPRPLPIVDAEDGEGDDEEANGVAVHLSPSSVSATSAPPTDVELSSLTLWPEVDKLYGHGNEVRCVTASADGRLLASSCTAKTRDAAAILLFDTSTWTCVGRVLAHTTTVSCLAFSPSTSPGSPTLLLSGSKDRHVALTLLLPESAKAEDVKAQQPAAVSSEKAAPNAPLLRSISVRLGGHSRIVWSCAWAPDGRLFATASRDKTVRLWSAAVVQGDDGADPTLRISGAPPTLLPPFGEAVTAVTFAPLRQSSAPASVVARYHLAVGCDSGALSLWDLDLPATPPAPLSPATSASPPLSWDGARCQLTMRIDPALCPQRTVHRLAFRPDRWKEKKQSGGEDDQQQRRETADEPPQQTEEQEQLLQLAVASADHTVRILQLAVTSSEAEEA